MKIEKRQKGFIDSENDFKKLLNLKVKGRISKNDILIRNKAINNYFAFGGYSLNSLISFVKDNNMSLKHKKRKVLRFLSNNPNITINEILQEDKPIKEDYAQKTFIVNYSFNKWGEVALNGRYEYILKSRFRYARRFLKMAILNE